MTQIYFDDVTIYDCYFDQTHLELPIHGRYEENITEDYVHDGTLGGVYPYYLSDEPNWFFGAERKSYTVTSRGRTSSFFAKSDADETLLNRVYVDPLEVAVEFITEYTEHDITIWNAYSDQTIQLTDVQVLNQSGTDMDYPSLPKTILQTYDEVLTLIILEEGPPTQDTDWVLTIEGTEYTIEVTGIRVVSFVHEPNFRSNVNIVYNWITSIARHPSYLKEQRRPLQRWPLRDINFTVHAQDYVLQQLYNDLHYGKDKVFAVPIFTEMMQPSSITSGLSSVTISTDITHFYNLQNNCEYVMIINTETLDSEVKELSGIAGQVLSFNSNITGSYSISNCFIYPCVFSYTKSTKINPETHSTIRVSINFGEFKRTSGV
jgi:hypothetical protein